MDSLNVYPDTDTLTTSVDFTIDRIRPYARAVEVRDGEGIAFYSAEWRPEGDPVTGYTLSKSADRPLLPGSPYVLTLSFSEPLSELTVSAAGFGPLPVTGDQENIVYTADFTAPGGVTSLNGVIECADLAGNEGVALSAGLDGFEPEKLIVSTSNPGGPDASHLFRIGDDGEPPTLSLPLWVDGSQLWLKGTNTPESVPWYTHVSTPGFHIADYDSGLKSFAIAHETAGSVEPVLTIDFPPGVPTADLAPYLSQDASNYHIIVADNIDNLTDSYFHVDRHAPELNIERVGVRAVSGGFELDAYTVMVDTVSGIGDGPLAVYNPEGTVDTSYAGPAWPPGEERLEKLFPSLAGAAAPVGWNEYFFYGNDRAGNSSSRIFIVTKHQETFPFGLSSGHYALPASPTGLHIENLGPTSAMEGCTMLEAPVYNEVLVKVVARPKEEYEGPGQSWTDEYPIDLEYSPQTDVTLYHLSGGQVLVNTPEAYVPRYSSITVSADLAAYGRYQCGDYETAGAGALNARLTYDSIGGYRFETQYIDAGFDMFVEFENIRVEVAEVVTPGNITLSRVAYDPRVAGYKLSTGGEVADISVTAGYEGGLRVSFRLPEGLTAAQTAKAKIYHYSGGSWRDVTTARADGWVSCEVAHASPFALAIPLDDELPPVTAVAFADGRHIGPDGAVYVSSSAAVSLTAVDSSLTQEVAGVATTYYLVDAVPDQACLLTPRDPLAAPGTCANPYYNGPFTLAEGERVIHYFSVDHLDNYETLKSTSILSDGTPPWTALYAPEGSLPPGAAVQLAAGDEISLEAGDPVSGGAAAGLAGILYYVDVEPSLCAGIVPSTSAANGTCENPSYAGPFTLPAGEHVVYYTAEDNVGNMAPVSSVFISVNDGLIEQASIAPSSGPIGLPFTITGEGFGTYSAGTTVVLIGGAAAPLTLWSTTTIKGTVPGALAAGEYPVVVMRGTELLAETSSFTVVVPALADIAPSSGPIGLPFTLTGSGFGNYVANYTRVLIGGATCPLTLWTDTQIKGTVPGTIAIGEHEVVVERALNGGLARSATVTFDLRGMEADWIAPSSGPIGMPFTINGAGFGNYLANYTTVLMGGTTCPLTLWADGQIKGTVPGGLAAGQYPVLVERRTADGGVMQSPPMSFEVLAVDAASMTPVAGPIGMPFTVYGTGFGNYSAGWTRVLIGGTTAPLTLWTDTQIKGTVPGTIEPGAHEVVVERQLNGGLAASQPLGFTLLVPDLAAVTPSSGPIGLPFTLTGSGFGNYVANSARVLIGGTTCPLTLWTDSQIKGTTPGIIEPGMHEVVVERAFNGGVSRSQALGFELADPVLETVSPEPAAMLAPFTLTGYSFGNYVAGKSEALIGGATAQLTLWTDTQIKGKLPALGEGEYPVLVRRSFNGGIAQSAASTMTIVEPSVSSMTPVSGEPGAAFSVFGSGFGPYDAAIARVTIGGLLSSLSLWTDGRINGTVPAELGVGTHTVIVSRGQYQGDPLDFYIPDGGGYNPAFMAPLAPSAAFRLGEVYVYPNPAKGGAVPVFHLEFGLADRVELKVYSVAGSLVHERTLTGPPQMTSPVYAYEYAWDGHIASGVYYFTVEAERAGAKLKARGKFAVVR
ncbi:MAG TPA: hypothetical protein DDW67_04850 [Elusimicrobia bacterium]|nr:hypothetical protein [Elusimicrobiota bacterium]